MQAGGSTPPTASDSSRCVAEQLDLPSQLARALRTSGTTPRVTGGGSLLEGLPLATFGGGPSACAVDGSATGTAKTDESSIEPSPCSSD